MSGRPTEAKRVAARRRYALDPEKHRARSKAYWEANPARLKYHNRRTHLKQYDMTPEDFEAMAEAQDYSCAICGTEDWTQPRGLVIDHDHETGQVRKLLCSTCNGGLGMFFDDPDLTEKATAYLRNFCNNS